MQKNRDRQTDQRLVGRDRLLVLPLLLVGGWLLSCDEKDRTGGAATVEEFCTSLVQSLTRQQAACIGGTPAYWTKSLATTFDCAEWSRRIASGAYIYDPGKGAQCLDNLAYDACEDSGSVHACTGAISGTIPSGGACSLTMTGYFAPCAPGNRCIQGFSICGGTCQPVRQPGQTCGASCADGSSCQYSTGFCVQDVGEGKPCQGKTAGNCILDHYCEGGSTSTEGVCRKKKVSGPCATAEECAERYYCVGGEGTKSCQKAKWVGAPCTPGRGECYLVYSWCGPDGTCTEAKAQEGQACGIVNAEYVACAGDLVCTQNTCRKGLLPGSSCTLSGGCIGGTINYCDEATMMCVSCM